MDHCTLQHLVQKLEKFDVSFKEFHFGVLDLIDEVEHDDEPAVLDVHDNEVTDTTAHNQQISVQTPKPEPLSSD